MLHLTETYALNGERYTTTDKGGNEYSYTLHKYKGQSGEKKKFIWVLRKEIYRKELFDKTETRKIILG